jgi:methylmalonyl-CoA/ethylmalonyl-CoA epimerase
MSNINHVAAVVRDLEAAIRVLSEGFGFKADPIFENQKMGVRVSFVQAANTRIELIQPVAPGAFMDFLQKGQVGFNHIAIEVGAIRNSLEKLNKMGIKPDGAQFTGSKGEVQNLDLSTTADLRLQIFEPTE